MDTRYDDILARLLSRNVSDDGKIDPKTLARRLSALSYRHHFIPEYYISGFCNDDGKFFVYDKVKDQILSRQLVSKSVFFENGRNNISVGDLEVSILEDFAYRDTDNKLATIFQKILDAEKYTDIVGEEVLPHLLIFVVDLFWRNPHLDNVFKDVYDRATIRVIDADGNVVEDMKVGESIKDAEWRFKVERMNIVEHTIRKIIEADQQHVKVGKFVTTTDLNFILGDFPIIYESAPQSFADIGNLRHIFPISARHLYFSSVEPDSPYKLEDNYFLNAIQIHQAAKIVISSDEDVLKKSLKVYKYLLSIEKLDFFRQSFFL